MLKTIPENDIIELKHITHIQDESSFIVIYTSQSKNYISEEAFDKVEKVLNNSGFIKVNHNTLINISFISNNINFGHKRSINIFGITYINVSRRKMQLLKDVIKNRK
ncbi:MAG: LytTR family DNA-binding domain-containing protein [Paludibacter sp.]